MQNNDPIDKVETLLGKYVDLSHDLKKIMVEPVERFPFNNFEAFKDSFEKNEVSMHIPFSARFKIVGHMNTTSSHLIWPVLLIVLPTVYVITMSIYFQNYYLLLSLLSFPLFAFIFYPNARVPFGTIFHLLVYAGLGYGIWQNLQWLIVISGIGVICHITMKLLHGYVVYKSTDIITNNESVFCILWNLEEIILDMGGDISFHSTAPGYSRD